MSRDENLVVRSNNVKPYDIDTMLPKGKDVEKISCILTLAERDALLEKKWEEFTDVPMNPDTEEIEEEFICFGPGTAREDIWKWFDERHSKGVAWLLYRQQDELSLEIGELYRKKSLCSGCSEEYCAYRNPEGYCVFPMISGRLPNRGSAVTGDWCRDFCTKGSPLEAFVIEEVDFRLKHCLNIPEKDISDELREDCIQFLCDNSDVMFDYDSIDSNLIEICEECGIEMERYR